MFHVLKAHLFFVAASLVSDALKRKMMSKILFCQEYYDCDVTKKTYGQMFHDTFYSIAKGFERPGQAFSMILHLANNVIIFKQSTALQNTLLDLKNTVKIIEKCVNLSNIL